MGAIGVDAILLVAGRRPQRTADHGTVRRADAAARAAVLLDQDVPKGAQLHGDGESLLPSGSRRQARCHL